MRQLPAKASMECAKLMLLGVNIMFMIIGFLLISIGAAIKTVYTEFDTFIINHYYNMSKAAIAIGIIMILISSFGCLAALKRSVLLINVYALVLSFVFFVNICLSLAAFLMVHRVKHTVEMNMIASIRKYQYDPNISIIWNKTQSKFHCCGVRGPEDWTFQNKSFKGTHISSKNGTIPSFKGPTSCCKKNSCENVRNVYSHGCLDVMTYLAAECSFLLGTGTICVALIEFLGVIFAILLAKSVRTLKTQILVDKNMRLQHLYEQLENARRTENVGPILYTSASSEA